MAAASIRWVLGRRISFIEPSALINLRTTWLSSMSVHLTTRCSRMSHKSSAGSNSVRKARSAATISASN
eukprot:7031828-Pyramimonas_sp.AAC.1